MQIDLLGGSDTARSALPGPARHLIVDRFGRLYVIYNNVGLMDAATGPRWAPTSTCGIAFRKPT